MDDLVNRLRANTPDDLHYEAADEIERLRALVAEWEQVWAMVTPGDSGTPDG